MSMVIVPNRRRSGNVAAALDWSWRWKGRAEALWAADARMVQRNAERRMQNEEFRALRADPSFKA